MLRCFNHGQNITVTLAAVVLTAARLETHAHARMHAHTHRLWSVKWNGPSPLVVFCRCKPCPCSPVHQSESPFLPVHQSVSSKFICSSKCIIKVHQFIKMYDQSSPADQTSSSKFTCSSKCIIKFRQFIKHRHQNSLVHSSSSSKFKIIKFHQFIQVHQFIKATVTI